MDRYDILVNWIRLDNNISTISDDKYRGKSSIIFVREDYFSFSILSTKFWSKLIAKHVSVETNHKAALVVFLEL